MAKPLTTDKLRDLLLRACAATPFSLLDDTLKFGLTDSSYVPAKDHAFVDSITGGTSKELSGTGYAAGFGGSGRKTVTGKAIIAQASGDPAFDAADPLWAGLDAGLPGYLFCCKPVTSDADSPLLFTVQLVTEATDGTDFGVHFPEDGIVPLKDVTP